MGDAGSGKGGPTWDSYLLWFMRAVGALWLAKGLMHWSVLLGVVEPHGLAFTALPAATQAAIIFYGVLDMIAGVGLWMASAWGGAIWLIASGSYLALEVVWPQVFGRQYPFIITVVVLIIVYFVLTYRLSRARRI